MFELLFAPLQQALTEHADARRKQWWEGYVKGSAPFLGVKMADVRSSMHRWHQDYVNQKLSEDEQLSLALALFQLRHSEEKLAGTLFLQEILLPQDVFRRDRELARFRQLFTAGLIYDWNLCDWFCVKVLGPTITRYGDVWARGIATWHRAANLWLARAALVAFVPVAHDTTYHPLIEEAGGVLIRRDERFAKTAVGWLLRDISLADPDFVHHFIDGHLTFFSSESLRNATKKLAKPERDHYLRLLKEKG